jgi:lysozyme
MREQPSAPRLRAPGAKATIGGGLAGAAALALTMAVAGLKPDEGKANVTYLDVAAIPTYCYGHADRSAKVGSYHSDEQCAALLSADARIAQAGTLRCVPALATRPFQWAAATRFAFNAGVPHFCSSTVAQRFNAGRWRSGCDALLMWNKARVHGRLTIVRGLTARRQRERAQCLTGVAA